MPRRVFGTIEPRYRPQELADYRAGRRKTKPQPVSWRARYRDPRAQPPLRGDRIEAPQTFTTKNQAEAWLSAVKATIDNGTWKHPDVVRAEEEAREREAALHARLDGVTVADWAETWLAGRERRGGAGGAAGTIRTHRSRLHRHILPRLGPVRLIDLTPQAVQEWFDDFDADVSGKVRADAYSTLRAMLNDAVKSTGTSLADNPCRVEAGGRADAVRGERYLLSPEQVQAIADEIRPEARALVLLLADGGLRINEALALHREDVVIGKRAAWVDVRYSLHRKGAKLVRGATKTKHRSRAGERRVEITPATARALAEHLDRYTPARADAPVFGAATDPGQYLRDSAARVWLDRALADAGIVIPADKLGGWHMFRHYSATRFGQAGATSAALMRRYGWSKPEQAMAYQRADADYERAILDRMAVSVEPGADTWAARAEAERAASAGVVSLNDRRRA
ncbi:tyrosine-type recombinase/integrase [Actinomyces qiguomingii]|uniref:tyrosine-type recombinase/integrase n=1 Tax=Actinomyces qiguomingii TaxID=2057800 RepID=UPI000FFF0C41|nr:site-specific integrase [Actinomyces qiguomingii]